MKKQTKTNTNAPHPFVVRHQADVIGVLQGWDRLRLQGTLRSLYHPPMMEYYLGCFKVLFKEFKSFALQLSSRIAAATQQLVERTGRPLLHLNTDKVSKEKVAREVAARDGIATGLIMVISAVEACRSYRIVRGGPGERPGFKLVQRKCLHYYFYWLDEEVGFCHLRLQTWVPFQVQICLNGREWLARAMDKEGIAYRREANCFAWIEDLERAQALLNQQHHTDWKRLCRRLLKASHPLARQLCWPLGEGYYWTALESEYATDVMFKSRAALQRIYPALVQHATLSFGSEQVLRFLDRTVQKLGRSDLVATDRRRTVDGVRVKSWLRTNSVKFYDKRSVLRSEVTINEPGIFRVWRASERQPQGAKKWRELRRGVADLQRRAELSRKASERQLEALASVHVRTKLGQDAAPICRPRRRQGRRHRALQPFGADARLLSTINRSEFVIEGFRNRDLRARLYGPVAAGSPQQRRQSAAITRKLQLLRAHGIIRKIQRTHRYQVTRKGRILLTALQAASDASTEALTALAA
jgi:hypothetical protein